MRNFTLKEQLGSSKNLWASASGFFLFWAIGIAVNPTQLNGNKKFICNTKRFAICLLLIASLAFNTKTQAQTFTDVWNLTSTTTPTTTGNISSAAPSFGVGLTNTATNNGTYGFEGRDWSSSSTAPSATSSAYLQFQIAPNTGYTLNITGLSLDSYNSEGNLPDALVIYCSTSSTFATGVTTVTNVSINNNSVNTSPSINVTATSGQTMYFRIIFYYTSSSSVKFGATSLTLSGTCTANCTTPSGSIAETDASGTASDDKVCSGGTATLTAPTGTTYLWSTGATTAAISPSNITASTAYNVTVSNTSSCTASFTNTVTMATPSVSITETDASGNSNDGIVCSGGTATLAATTGYTYLWTSSVTTSSITTAALTSTTSYTVTATNAGCTATSSSTVTVAPTPGVTITETDNSGTANDGKVCTSGSATLTANPTGGTAYTYAWTGGTTASTLGVSPGSTTAYSVTVTNAGCSAASASASSTITVVSPPSATITETDASGNANDGIVCSGGTVSLSVTTGTGFTYTWSTAATTSSITTAALSTATTYNVTVSNAGCTATGTSSVAIAATPSATLTEADASGTSNDGTVCQSGTATLSAPNTAGYTYLWNTSATTYNITTPGLTSNTTYSVTVTNDGCSNATASASYTVTVDPAISVAPTGTSTICYNKTISANASGGSGTFSSYAWSGGLSAVASPSVTASNTYIVTVTDGKACTATGTTGAITVDVAVTASPTATSSICYGATISAGAGGGTSPYTYAWSGSLAATATPSVTATGTYMVTVTDSKNCSVTGTTGTITVDPAVTVSPTATSTKCYNTTISAGASGGTSPYTYSWSGGLAASASPAVTTSGTYTVIVTDNKSCTATGTTGVITVDPAVTASPTGASTICSGSTIAANAGGGSAVYSTYAWSGGLAGSATPAVTTAGTYSVTITDNAGCSVTGATGAIAIAATPSPAITEADASGTSNDGTVCQSGTATLSAPNTAGYTYLWNTSATTYNITTPGLTSNTTYSVTVTNDGCSNATASASYTVTADPAISVAPTGTNSICYNATISANASGGSGTFSTYAWSGSLSAVANPNVTSSNTYTVTATDNKGCSATGSTGAISVDAAVTASPTGSSSICSGAIISAGAGGGTPGYTYAWSGGLAAVATPAVTSPGTYIVTVTDSKSCSVTGTTGSITVYSTTLSLSAVPTNETTCNNGTGAMTLSNSGGSGSYHYLWSNGTTTQNLSSLTSGTYTVTVTDITCTAVSATTSGTVTAPWVAYAGGFDPLCTSSVDLAASIGGAWPTSTSSTTVFSQNFSGSYSGWTSGTTDWYGNLPAVSTADNYCNHYPSSPNCVVFDSYYNDGGSYSTLYSPTFSLSGVSSPSLSYSLINRNGGYGFWVLISTDGGNTWTTISTNPTTSGNSFVTETIGLSAYAGQSNCMLAWEQESNYGNSQCNDDVYVTNVSVTGNASTQATPTFSWSGAGTVTGSTGQFATASTTGTYTVSVTMNGCTAKANTTVSTPVIPAATISASPSTVCPGATSTLTFAGLAPGGLAADFNGTTSSIGSALLSYADNFTVEFWVKPTAAITMTSEVTSGVPAGSGESYAITPAGTGSSTTSGAGVSVGTNGVIVFENYSSNLPSLLVYNGGTNSLNGWNHIALVYTNKTPSIYINGNFVMEGLTSTMSHVYASLGTSIATYGPFSGYLDDIRVWNGAKTQAQIAQDMFLLTPITTSPTLEDQYTFNNSNANDNINALNLTATSVTYVAPSYFTYTVTGTGAPAATTATSATTSALTNAGTSSITNTYDVTASTTGGCTGTSTSVGGTGATVVVKSNASIGSVTGTSPLCVGGTATFTANSVVVSGGTGAWSSSNTSVATINSAGLVTAVGAGTCNIICTITGGCGGTVSAQQALTVTAAPSSLSYTINAPTYCPGSAITTNSPSNTGGVATSYSVSPALPTGLSLSAGTGAITGTPTTTTATATYTVTATNACGGTNDGLNITIATGAPTSLTYTSNTITYCPGTAISTNSPSSGGGAPTSYSVSPALPVGLSLNTGTGVITGTPTTLTATATYTVTATNSCGSTTDGLSITIANGSPTSLTYTINSPTYCPGSAITTNLPSNSGGIATSYSVSPALPTGLSLNTSTGAITGTPTTATVAATYTVTATNSCGNATDGLNITISPAAPTSLIYTLNTAVYCPGSAITANSPSNSGGAPTSYSISPALPVGLSLNTGTGVITGTPTTATVVATYTVTATNSCGSTTVGLSITISPAAPTSLAYTINSPVYCSGSAISANSPSNSGGAATSYSVSPALPAGLSLNTGTGAITGSPTTATASATYTVTATNSCGSTTDGLTITISPAAPTSLSYTLNTAVYCPGSAITANSPSNSGGASTSYSVSPALPAGLSLNTGTGVITGTPTTATAVATYTVTATNSCGSTTKGISITISPAAPTSLTYTINSPAYCPGTAITTNSPSNSGGAATSYSVSPTLPAGLSLNTSTGAITGTPTTATAAATYTVTATNSCGSTTDGLNITISPAAPTSLSYSLNTGVYCPGSAITANSPSNGGGAPTSYSVSPALPAGLSLNTGTGVITGTPTTATAVATYTVTATNSCGSTTKGISITISPAAPTSLTYTINSPAYCPGTAITTNSPSNGGGAATSYSVSPTLPAGLSLNTSTGAITGTPTTATAAATYTVTATNSCGSTTDGLNITISPAAPSGLNYTLNSATYCPGTAIATNSPTSSGGAPTSYSVSPALPAGLSLNTGTGKITGTPTTATTIATYTVTATNSCGSTSDGLSITVSPAAPTSLTYTVNSPTYCPGTAISTNSPSNSGGAPTSYSVSPTLPTGLSLNAGTGAITGTPTTATTAATYTVTATNSCGSTTDGLTVTISPAAPTSLSYTLNSASYCVGTAITTNSASSSGGAPTSYSVSPTLPAGLSLNTSTGDITGTPTSATASAIYTVTATNSCGSTTVGLTIATDALVSSYGTITASAGTTQSLCSSVTPAGTFSVTGATGGSGSFSYQWYSQSGIQSAPDGAIPGSWTVVNGATNSTFAPAGTTSSISYACAVTPGLPTCAGTTTWASGVLNFTVSTPTAFITGGNDSVCATSTGTNVLTASTTYTATWQWQSSTDNLNFTNISGATSTTYPAPTSSAGVEYYHAVATYSGGSGCTPATSNNEYVAVNSQPAIVTQPGTVSMCQGGTGDLAVIFSGGVGATYQWQVNYGFSYSNVADNNSNAPGITYGGSGTQNPLTVISSANSYTATLPYKVIIHYSGAGCTASLTSSSGSVTINPQPIISTQPTSSTSICSGSNTSLTVSAIRGYALSYEWQYYNNTTSTWADVTAGAPAGFSYTGATGTTLSINTTNGTSPAGSYNYQCIVHSTGSDCNPATSNTGTIVVVAHPASFTPTVSANPVCITSSGGGTNIQVASSVSGVNYQLQNITGPTNVGSPVSGTGSTINLPTGSIAANAIYQVVATAVSGGCTTTSSIQDTVVAVNPDIAIGTQLSGQHFTFGTMGNPALPVGWTNPVTSGLVWGLSTSNPASSGSYSYYNGSGGMSNASSGAYITTPVGSSTAVVSLVSGTINTTGYSNISVQWGAQKSVGYAGTVNLYYSTDNGSTWSSAISFTDAQDNLTGSPWVLVNNGVQIKLPAACSNISTLKLKWTANAASAGVYYSMNDIGIYGLSTISNCGGTSISVNYLNTSCTANAYSIGTSNVSGVGSSWTGLTTVSNASLPGSAINVTVPSATATGIYDVDLTVNDGAGHSSNTISLPIGTDPAMTITSSLDNCSCHNTRGIFGNVVTVFATGGSGSYYFNSSAAVDSLQTTIDAGGNRYSGSTNHNGVKGIFWSKADGNTHTYNISDGLCSTTTTQVTQSNIPTTIPFASATNNPVGLPGAGGGNGLSGSFNDNGLGDPTINNINGPALRCHQTADFGNSWVIYQVNNLTSAGAPVDGDSTNNKAVVEIQNNGVDLDSVTVSVYRDANLPQVPSSSTTSAACEGYQGYAMERHFMIKSTKSMGPNSFSTPVGVRLYFTDAEFQDLKYWTMRIATTATGQAAGCAYLDTVTNINSIYVTKYTGANEDGDYNNNAAAPSGLYRVFGKNAVENGNSPLTAIDGGAAFLTTGGNSNLHYVQMNVTEFSEFWLGGSSGGEALPVSMLYMEAEALNNDSIQVRWATAMEINNHEFNIERSTDGQTWSTIATLPGHDNSTHENDYTYNDLNVAPGVRYYYRLKQVDNNGNYQYTEVVQAMITASGTFTVMNFVPNPTAGSTQLTVTTTEAQQITVDFYDMLGQRIYTTNEDAVPGNNRISFDLHKFTPGTYSVVVTAQSQTYTKKIVITR